MNVLKEGLRAGLLTAWRLLRVMLPFSVAFDLLARTGVLAHAGMLASPLMAPFGLPGESAVALATGMTVNLYGAIAAAASLVLVPAQVTVLGLMLGFAHTLPVESAVLRAVGTRWALLLAYRVGMLVIAGLLLGTAYRLWGAPPEAAGQALASALPAGVPGSAFTLDSLVEAFRGAVGLTVKIILIVVPILTAYEILRALRPVRRAGEAVAPALAPFGISRGGAVALFAGLMLGISYGGGIILRVRETHALERGEVFRISLILCTCHAIVEDTLLFAAIGANGWIIAGARVLLAGALLGGMAAVRASGPPK